MSLQRPCFRLLRQRQALRHCTIHCRMSQLTFHFPVFPLASLQPARQRGDFYGEYIPCQSCHV